MANVLREKMQLSRAKPGIPASNIYVDINKCLNTTTVYIVCVRVSVNLVNKFLLTFLHCFFSRQIRILSGTFKCVPITNKC